jgi:site-specific DNA recombinase
MFQRSMKAAMDGLEIRKAELVTLLNESPSDVPDILPSTSKIYAKKVGRLAEALSQPDDRAEATEALRNLIERIALSPGPCRGEMNATLYGELDTILSWMARQAQEKSMKTKTPAAVAAGVSVSVVAGTRFEPLPARSPLDQVHRTRPNSKTISPLD